MTSVSSVDHTAPPRNDPANTAGIANARDRLVERQDHHDAQQGAELLRRLAIDPGEGSAEQADRADAHRGHGTESAQQAEALR